MKFLQCQVPQNIDLLCTKQRLISYICSWANSSPWLCEIYAVPFSNHLSLWSVLLCYIPWLAQLFFYFWHVMERILLCSLHALPDGFLKLRGYLGVQLIIKDRPHQNYEHWRCSELQPLKILDIYEVQILCLLELRGTYFDFLTFSVLC